jgi:hypothetical protein
LPRANETEWQTVDENKPLKSKPDNSTESLSAYPLEIVRALENSPAKARRK